MPSVFVHIKVGDYVPKGLAGFADALANPIQYQDQIEEQIRKRTEALNKLLEEAKDIVPANPAPAPAVADPTPTTSNVRVISVLYTCYNLFISQAVMINVTFLVCILMVK